MSNQLAAAPGAIFLQTLVHCEAPQTSSIHNTCDISDRYIRHACIQASCVDLELVDIFAMSSAMDLSSVTHTPALSSHTSLFAQYAMPVARQAVSAHVGQDEARTSMWGAFGRLILVLLSIIPGILVWLITFTTITLPTWLFLLFSTTLTFTMNATTLCV